MFDLQKFIYDNDVVYEEKRIRLILDDGSVIEAIASDLLEEDLGESPEDILDIVSPKVIKDNGKAEIYKEGDGVFPVLINEIESIELL